MTGPAVAPREGTAASTDRRVGSAEDTADHGEGHGVRLFVVFSEDEDGYVRWLHHHPDSLVLNCPKRHTNRTLIVHRASCRSIATRQRRGELRTHDALKVCATRLDDMRAWARRRELGRLRLCQRCHPVA